MKSPKTQTINLKFPDTIYSLKVTTLNETRNGSLYSTHTQNNIKWNVVFYKNITESPTYIKFPVNEISLFFLPSPKPLET